MMKSGIKIFIILCFLGSGGFLYSAEKVSINFGGILPVKESDSSEAENRLFSILQNTAGRMIDVKKVPADKLRSTWESYDKKIRASLKAYGSSRDSEIMELVNSIEGDIASFMAGAYTEGKNFSGILYIYDKKKGMFLANKQVSAETAEVEIEKAVRAIAENENYFIRNTGKGDGGKILFVYEDYNSRMRDKPLDAFADDIKLGILKSRNSEKVFIDKETAYYYSLGRKNLSDIIVSVKNNSLINGILYLQFMESDKKEMLLFQFYHKDSDSKTFDQMSFSSEAGMLKSKQNIINRIYAGIASKMQWPEGSGTAPLIVREFSNISPNQMHYPYGIDLINDTIYAATIGSVFSINSSGFRIKNISIDTGSSSQQYTPFNHIAIDGSGTFFLLNNVTREVYRVNNQLKITGTYTVNAQSVTGLACASDYIFILGVDNGKYFISRFDSSGKKTEYKSSRQIQALASRGKRIAFLEIIDSGLSVSFADADFKIIKTVPLPFNISAFYPSALAVDDKENIYMLDATKSRLCKISAGGDIIWNINPVSSLARGTLSSYGFIQVDDSGNDIYISDTMNKRIIHLRSFREPLMQTGISSIKGAKDINSALAIAYESLAKNIDSGEINIYLGDYYAKMNLHQKAIEMYRSALNSGYSDTKIIDEKIGNLKISSLYIQARENHDEYENRLKNAGPESAKPFYQLAVEGYEKILKMDPKHSEAASAYKTLKKSSSGSTETHIAFKDIRFESVFSSLYKFYADNPIGSCTVTNTSGSVINKLQVTVFFKDYMDYPTESRVIRDIEPGESKSVKLFAVFTNRILDITEDTPVSAEITASYSIGNSESKSSRAVNAKVYNRNALTWDKTDKLSSFVTHRDPVVKNFARVIVQQFRNMELTLLNGNLQRAIQVFDTLGVYGMTYVRDPKTPYDSLAGNASAVDYIQFPRESLKYKSGDCDDLTVLYSSLLEHLGIDTAFITVPGHIFLAVNTGIPASSYQLISSSKDQLLFHNGLVWIPVEVTSLGDSFLTAWVKGAQQVFQHKASGKLEVIEVSSAWKSYQPVTLPPLSWDAAVPSLDAALRLYNKDINSIIEREIISRMKNIGMELEKNPGNPAVLNRAGITYAMFGKYDKAEEYFLKALKSDPANGHALTNMGNLNMAQGKNKEAIDFFNRAKNAVGEKGYLLVNLVKLYERTGETEKALDAYNKIVSTDKQLAEKLSPPGSSTERASDKKEAGPPVWAGD